MATIVFVFTLTTLTCSNCGVTFGVPEHWVQKRREDHATFYCPNGHNQWFPQKSEAEKLRDELAREKHRTEQAQADALWWRNRQEETVKEVEHTTRRLRAHKGIVTKLRKRVAKGVCPCCHVKFKNLRDHMREQHPDWNPEKGAEALAEKA